MQPNDRSTPALQAAPDSRYAEVTAAAFGMTPDQARATLAGTADEATKALARGILRGERAVTTHAFLDRAKAVLHG